MATPLRVLDLEALRVLVTEDNSSKFAVDAHHRGIEKIADLSGMPKLYSLDVSFNRLTQLEHLHTAKDLRELKAYNNQLTSASGLKGNQNLEAVLLSDNAIEALPEDLTALFKLKTLQLHGNRISRIEHLKNARHLTYLDLSRNRIAGALATGLQTLSALEYLNVSDNLLSSIGNIESLKKLDEVNVSGNKLTSLSGVYPPSLSVLRADRNQIADVMSLPLLPALTELYVEGNQLQDVGILVERAPQMETLDLRNNRLRSIMDLRCFQAYATLEDLWLRGNPCTLSSTYLVDALDFLPTLQFLDDLKPQQIRESPNPTKLLEALATRPATPGRPITPGLSRPSSASSRPSTAEGRPLIARPSSRAGLQTKMLSPADVEKAQSDVRGRLEKLRAMMDKLCGGDTRPRSADIAPHETRSTVFVTATSSADIYTVTLDDAVDVTKKAAAKERPDAATRAPPMMTPPKAIPAPVAKVASSLAPRVHTTTVKKHDMGTDPLEDNAIPIRPASAVTTPRRETGNQSTLDAADTEPATVEEAMKRELLSGLVHTDDIVLEDNITKTNDDDEVPFVDSARQAEKRARPTAAERSGFRLFRIPASAKRFMQSTVAT
ncbi:hypothetical protein SPRG_04589 [Saprolegnia parasitica CBS 223.65]|uniref:Protein phosphatase 1 regulatory subunit 7 n=1 Tax=Saprolegnia parasitica (strain CBS 223.65) TaxID=695850 RepID=A0A067CV99_SAPPC|nr:hypothetical protein SPRG_04589 [Saprolegnia parasitica CBS 223.65]KDO30687.1 hypothetical protein SPRG_04589 [Saprolegnia parasitica CBS 223.65]|eukprot:XP_012198391.1 hypothetical protein SPRG_04589 [Saprolegnia parasitica CBS 223.65]